MPKSTPYDGSPAARAAYQDGYREGYQAASSGDWIYRNDNQQYSGLTPRSYGWEMGHRAGMAVFMENDTPEKRIRERKKPSYGRVGPYQRSPESYVR